MQTPIHGRHFVRFSTPPNLFCSQTRRSSYDFLRIHPQKCLRPYKTLILRSTSSPQSLDYGGWDDFQPIDDSVHSGESYLFRNFLNSLGIDDKKYVFVYLFGFVCALAIARVRVSSIVVVPACAIVFALGYSFGLGKRGQLKELRLDENGKKFDSLRGSIVKLRNLGDNLKEHNSKVLDLKFDIRSGIECNQVTVADLEGYIDVIESAESSLINAIDDIESCIQNICQGKDSKEESLDHESGKRRNKSGENGFDFSRYFGGLFGGKFNGSKKNKKELMDVEVGKKKPDNILTAPPTKGRNLENKNVSVGDKSFDGTVRNEDFVYGNRMNNIGVGRNSAEANDTEKTMYSYQRMTSRFVNNRHSHLKYYQDETETFASRSDSYDSVDVRINMNHMKASVSPGQQPRYETFSRNYSHLESTEEDEFESWSFSNKGKNSSSFDAQKSSQGIDFGSSPLGRDLEFDRCLAEANNLLKEAKMRLRWKVDDCDVDHALHRSAKLLSKAIDIRPMSLLAVGELGNTYLFHGELKLRMSRDLRSLLVKTDSLSAERLRVHKRYEYSYQLANKDKIISALMNVCEECEELLLKAGRKYKLALSIDGSDIKALYNWGLALSFRAQLIADIGPSAASDADKIFMAAIDKFNAMMSSSNYYAPDALFRWGAALQQRSRLRPSRSREKAKLLQQARQLYEDALDMDSGNAQLQEALFSCISELDSIGVKHLR